jgi:flagellar biosynthesis anti-sigma factor FlgM
MKGITGNPVLDAYGRMAIAPVGAARPVEQIESAGNPAGASTPAAEVSISTSARELALSGNSGEYNADKVEALKASIAEGKFKIDLQNVARRMLDALG